MKLLLSFLLFSVTSFAQTVVNGGIYQNTTWTLAGSPYIVTGSIVVFHDSAKAFERLKIALPAVLAHFSNLGYSFKAKKMAKVETPAV